MKDLLPILYLAISVIVFAFLARLLDKRMERGKRERWRSQHTKRGILAAHRCCRENMQKALDGCPKSVEVVTNASLHLNHYNQ